MARPESPRRQCVPPAVAGCIVQRDHNFRPAVAVDVLDRKHSGFEHGLLQRDSAPISRDQRGDELAIFPAQNGHEVLEVTEHDELEPAVAIEIVGAEPAVRAATLGTGRSITCFRLELPREQIEDPEVIPGGHGHIEPAVMIEVSRYRIGREQKWHRHAGPDALPTAAAAAGQKTSAGRCRITAAGTEEGIEFDFLKARPVGQELARAVLRTGGQFFELAVAVGSATAGQLPPGEQVPPLPGIAIGVRQAERRVAILPEADGKQRLPGTQNCFQMTAGRRMCPLSIACPVKARSPRN